MKSIRKKRVQKKNFQATIILMIVICIVAAAIAGKVYIESTVTKFNDVTLCPIGKNTNRKIVLVDKTEPFSRVQKFALSNALDEITDQLIIGERLSIFVIDSNSQKSMKPVFDACNPGNGTTVNALYQNPAKYKKRWDEMFIGPLKHVKHDLVNENTENHSPIFEMLQAISLSSLSNLSISEEVELHIFSDMMHHTNGYSLYSKANLDPNKLFDKPYYQKVMTNLHGAKVHLHYVRRDGHESLQTNRNVVFWEKYFASINAKLSSVVRLDG